ncbi:hypothetical protein C0416_05585 [bacterium]|nr:hypothetical protein [bacterium]
MSLEKMSSTGANKDVCKESSGLSKLRKWFNNTIMAVMTAAVSVTGGYMVTSTAGCAFDTSGLSSAKDAGPDVDADADADIDSDGDGDVDGDILDEICNNGLDDDEDGLKDCADPDCDQQEGPNGGTCSTTEVCGDDYDNNGDGLVDCADVATCEGFADPRGFECTADGYREETNCGDGLDNDGDWSEDCDDPDCAGTTACTVDPENCNNGIDDDGDTKVDCADSECVGQTGQNGEDCEATELTCDDGYDNDGDGLADCEDSDCNGTLACAGEICNNGIDDDTDGLVDCADPDCDNFSNGLITCAYEKPWETNCNDGINNDGNGTTDCADPICAALPVCGGGAEICDNGLDDDADGFVDCLDGACILNTRCTPFTSPGGSNPGQLCPTWLPTPCNVGRTAQVTLTCAPTDLSCY